MEEFSDKLDMKIQKLQDLNDLLVNPVKVTPPCTFIVYADFSYSFSWNPYFYSFILHFCLLKTIFWFR